MGLLRFLLIFTNNMSLLTGLPGQVLEVGWLQEVERRKRRLTTSGSSEGVVQYREDILCEEILDN